MQQAMKAQHLGGIARSFPTVSRVGGRQDEGFRLRVQGKKGGNGSAMGPQILAQIQRERRERRRLERNRSSGMSAAEGDRIKACAVRHYRY